MRNCHPGGKPRSSPTSVIASSVQRKSCTTFRKICAVVASTWQSFRRRGHPNYSRHFMIMAGLQRGGLLAFAGMCLVGSCVAQFYEEGPFFYSDSEAQDPTAILVEKVQRGEVTLDESSDQAFLTDFLGKLGVPVASQVLVYSKTSFQNSRILPSRPRALYFSEEHYIGWVQGGDIEVISIDPALGPIFYVLSIPRPPQQKLTLFRSNECLNCHGGSRTAGVPGMLVRSVHADTGGFPLLGAGTFLTDHASPLSERWGGWYVTGEHDGERHMGNLLNEEAERGKAIVVRDHGKLKTLDHVITTHPYLTNTSDIVALMVLEHQIMAHNMITQSHYNVRRWLHYDRVLNQELEGEHEGLRETTANLINGQVDRLLKVMLFQDEVALEGWGVEGGEAFQAAFTAHALKASNGRSLKDFHLLGRLFRHRLSYMIYSQSFAHLPEVFRERFYAKLHAILTSAEPPEAYAYLKTKERGRILKILMETKPDFAKIYEGN